MYSGLGLIDVVNGGGTPAPATNGAAPKALPTFTAPAPTQDPSAPPSASAPAPLIHPVLAPLVSDGGVLYDPETGGMIGTTMPILVAGPDLERRLTEPLTRERLVEAKKAAAKTATAGVGGPLGLLLLLGLAGALVKGKNV